MTAFALPLRERMSPRPCPRQALASARWLAVAIACLGSAPALCQDSAASSDPSENKFLFVPYPITEPAIGSGLLAGPVWMREGPATGGGPSKPQAFGIGALWTDGGSRGLVAFDHRAWDEGRWRSTVLAGRAEIKLRYAGLSPEQDQDRGFNLSTRGFSLQAQRSLGKGPNSLGLRLFSARTEVDFELGLPPELAGARRQDDVAGIGVSWSRDTRDDVFTPSRGQSLSLGLTVHPSFLGSSFEQQTVELDWAAYRKAWGTGILGVRTRYESSSGDPPFYLRPYVSLRGVAAMRYAGERAGSLELEFRQPIGKRWDALVFVGEGRACSSRDGARGCQSVSTYGLGMRFKALKLFGLTFGLDLAQGPEGSVSYIQIGNAWSR